MSRSRCSKPDRLAGIFWPGSSVGEDGPGGLQFARLCGVIRKLKSGEYRLYSRKTDAKTGKRKNLGTFSTREAAEKHEKDVQYFKRAAH
jgi:hypothetical protein